MRKPNPALGAKVKDLRDERSWSQERLARELVRSRGTVMNIESGRTVPDIGTLVRLSEVFDLPLVDLVELSKPLVEEGAA